MENNIEDNNAATSKSTDNCSDDPPPRSIEVEKTENAENNADAKKSESAYSNSCNSQSKRSYSPKSTHSGSNSSGSSGYGEKQSTSAYCYKDDTKKKSEKTENNTKVSDSAYSNTYSNSQSRSYSSKSMHSGSNSSGSSGYGGKLSTSEYSQLPENRNKDKEGMKKKPTPIESQVTTDNKEIEIPTELEPISETPKEFIENVVLTPPPALEVEKEKPEIVETTTHTCSAKDERSFTCVVSMQDGIVLYATASMTDALGFTKDMLMGRSFIGFVHSRDANTFTSIIASGVSVLANANDAPPANHMSTMVCRIRQYKGLTAAAFQIKRKIISYMPYLLKLYFKNINDEEGPVTYVVIKASPYFSAFKTSNELIINPKPFVIRHSATGILQYVDPESVPYLGYLPQDVEDKNALQLYHPSDLAYIRQVYEIIIRDGVMHRSRPYRMLTQNGNYLKLETEWSAFINPWSRKLEFVMGKHFIIQGPENPDVFQSLDNENIELKPEDEEIKAEMIKNIIQVMDEVPTKPLKIVKQQMSTKCHNLALYMESLMEDPANNDYGVTVETPDVDNSINEPDSVMLGGMSPHHDLGDSKSSSETPISYNQLNYNQTLQRYFDNQEHCEEYNLIALNNNQDSGDSSSKCVSPDENAVEEDKTHSDANLVPVPNCNDALNGSQNSWLTESMLKKHNIEMEKELVKIHRENRCTNKGEKEKLSNELRQKKKDHLARCNMYLQQGIANIQPLHQGLKRSSIQIEESIAQKHRCMPERLMQQTQGESVDISSTSAVINTLCSGNQFPSMDMADYKMDAINSQPSCLNQLTQCPYQSQIPCMMLGQPVYGSPFMYSSMDPNGPYNLQQSLMSQIIPNTLPLAIPTKNYEQACKMTFLPRTGKPLSARKKAKAAEKKKSEACDISNTSIEASKPIKESATETPDKSKLTPSNSVPSNPTDEESNYSSLYSSFFKTDSGSNEDNDMKNVAKQSQGMDGMTSQNAKPANANKTMAPKRNIQPPWMDHVHVTSELIYKYQIVAKDLDEVLKADREKLETLEQPELVNEQLGQLYMELERDGLPAELNLEEGITSSSSSGEEILVINTAKLLRRKREYSQLVMIYEEDAPLPPPDE